MLTELVENEDQNMCCERVLEILYLKTVLSNLN